MKKADLVISLIAFLCFAFVLYTQVVEGQTNVDKFIQIFKVEQQ